MKSIELLYSNVVQLLLYSRFYRNTDSWNLFGIRGNICKICFCLLYTRSDQVTLGIYTKRNHISKSGNCIYFSTVSPAIFIHLSHLVTNAWKTSESKDMSVCLNHPRTAIFEPFAPCNYLTASERFNDALCLKTYKDSGCYAFVNKKLYHHTLFHAHIRTVAVTRLTVSWPVLDMSQTIINTTL